MWLDWIVPPATDVSLRNFFSVDVSSRPFAAVDLKLDREKNRILSLVLLEFWQTSLGPTRGLTSCNCTTGEVSFVQLIHCLEAFGL